jgi:Mg2+/Co2+ transporter CorC
MIYPEGEMIKRLLTQSIQGFQCTAKVLARYHIAVVVGEFGYTIGLALLQLRLY